jgi:two-component system OmpR family response regulator/two-component system response regulator QseB
MRILLVEDDTLLGDGIEAGLQQARLAVDWVKDGIAADVALSNTRYDAVVLDLGLPRLGGLELLRRLRARRDPVPVLILTARDTVEERVAGLDSGADDYMVKPFDLAELAARLRALVRRSAGQPEPRLRARDIELDPAAHTVTCKGQPLELGAREFALLHALMLNPGRVLTREQIAERLYAWGEEIESNAIDVHIHHLRRKLAADCIRTVRGVGYLVPRESDG